ncbi:hypothetical protein SAMN05443665_11041, partial [Actinomadura meyerae]
MHGQPNDSASSTSDQVTGPAEGTRTPGTGSSGTGTGGRGSTRTGRTRTGAAGARTGAGAVPDPFAEGAPRTPHWFKTAVFYEVSVRGFADSNNDGYGDLRGLIS